MVEAATSDGVCDIIAGTYVDALPETDFTAKVPLDELPAGADIFYRVQARRYPQHRVAERQRALHGGALLRPRQGAVSGFRAVLGVRLGSDPRRRIRAEHARQHVRAAAGLPEDARQGPADGAVRRAALRIEACERLPRFVSHRRGAVHVWRAPSSRSWKIPLKKIQAIYRALGATGKVIEIAKEKARAPNRRVTGAETGKRTRNSAPRQ